MADPSAIDVVCNVYFDDGHPEERPDWLQNFLQHKIGAPAAATGGASVEAFIERMDEARIEHAFLVAVRSGSYLNRIGREVRYEHVAGLVQKFPQRFSGLAGIDPTRGMAGVRELEHAVRELGFKGAHLYPHWFEMAPDHALYYPYYAKCAELEVPVQIQVGHCLRYSEERPLRSVGRPITLDTVACHFPELAIVGIHIGWPWTEEMIAVSYKHPNVYVASDAHAPRYWSTEFVRYIDSWGQDKVLFGTDYPVIDPLRAMTEIAGLPIRDGSRRKFLRDNAAALYRLDLDPS